MLEINILVNNYINIHGIYKSTNVEELSVLIQKVAKKEVAICLHWFILKVKNSMLRL